MLHLSRLSTLASRLQSSTRSLQYVQVWRSLSSDVLRVSEEVKAAVAGHGPVVALESTIITHGMPHPHNYSTAVSVERCVRQAGAVPATVAVLDGRLCVGLSDEELQFLSEPREGLWKVSRRDLAWVLSQGLSGGTTVSGTMIAAHMAGVSVFATGGIGGVHRGAEDTMDVSADLTELGRTPVAVVSAGVKSILDIPKTLEYLETQGVTVATLGPSPQFPAFFTSDSGHLAPLNIPTALEAARAIATNLSLGLSSGLLLAVPIPPEHEAKGRMIHDAIEEALIDARAQGIKGREVTPFVLGRVNQLTGGASLKSNIALVENNARVAAEVATCLSTLRRAKLCDPACGTTSTNNHTQKRHFSSKAGDRNKTTKNFGRPVVVGGTVIDLTVKVKDSKDLKFDGGTYAGKLMQSYGGVGRNLADCMSRLDLAPMFVSVVGDDTSGQSVKAACNHMDFSSVMVVPSASTASYSPILRADGSLMFGVGDFDVFSTTDDLVIQKAASTLDQNPPVLILDGNFSVKVIEEVTLNCAAKGVPVWYEPTDCYSKAFKPFRSEAWQYLNFITPNLAELETIYRAYKEVMGEKVKLKHKLTEETSIDDIIRLCVPLCDELCQHIPCVLLTMGRHGVLLCHTAPPADTLSVTDLFTKRRNPEFTALYFPELNKDSDASGVLSVSGAGDCLASGLLSGLIEGLPLPSCVQRGMQAAWMSLHANATVPASISLQSIKANTKDVGSWGPIDVSNGSLT